jgi:hypothetical protein
MFNSFNRKFPTAIAYISFCVPFFSLIDTGLFMTAAQHVYRSAGFQEREIYPETEVPPGLQSYWIYMETKSVN